MDRGSPAAIRFAAAPAMHLTNQPPPASFVQPDSAVVDLVRHGQPWLNCLNGALRARPSNPFAVGVLRGEGVGPEVVNAALNVLESVSNVTGIQFAIDEGGAIGRDAERDCGQPLSEEVVTWCERVFAKGGAIVNGPGGGRYVYDLRRRFDLFMKISPLQVRNGLSDAARVRSETLRDVDVLITRENAGGAYQGEWSARSTANGDRIAEHHVAYTQHQVLRFLYASARLARARRGEMTVVWKESGVPSISDLWRQCAEQAASAVGVNVRMVDIDLMAYRLVQEPNTLDVVAAPNLFGDVLADLGAVLLGSRGNSFSGNFTERGEGIYQTNHGAAYDIAGRDTANPAGQILSLAMMLRESFGLHREAAAIEEAQRSTWRDGWRTSDVAVPGSRVIGTRDMGQRVAEATAAILRTTKSEHVAVPRLRTNESVVA